MRFISAESLDRDPTAVRTATREGPVVITDNGAPTHVLMTIADFERLGGSGRRTLWNAFADRHQDDLGDDFPKLDIRTRPVNFDE